jgi:hypothetical protein
VQIGVLVQVGRQNTWRVVPFCGTEVSRFVAVEVKAMLLPEFDKDGSTLAPFAEFPNGSVLNKTVRGVQPAAPRQVVVRYTSLLVFLLLVTKLLEMEA